MNDVPATDSISVAVQAFDPISLAGLISQLRFQSEVRIIEDGHRASVTIIIVDQVDDRAVQLIRSIQRPDCQVVLIVSKIRNETLLAAAEAGCIGLLRRAEATPDRLIAAVRAAATGNGTLASDLLGQLFEEVGRLQRNLFIKHELTAAGLTRRELSVLKMVAEGLPTHEIAKRLSYSQRTIKNIIHDVTTRLQVRNRAQAVACAIREGMI